MHFINAAILALAAEASAKTITVEVGKSGLKYTPDSITPAKGDVVEFHFDSAHTVVAGDFKKPCTPATSGGFYSGQLPSDKDSVFSITINNTDPIFFYCAIEGHCQAGMVGVINEGTDTLASYQKAASSTDKSVTPKAVFGGTVGDKAAASTTETKTSTKTSTKSTTTATSTGAAVMMAPMGASWIAVLLGVLA